MDIIYFLDEFKERFGEVKIDLDRLRKKYPEKNILDVTINPYVSLDDLRKTGQEIGMNEQEVERFHRDLQETARDLPDAPGCLPLNKILDYVEGITSEIENKKYYKHLIHCEKCQEVLFSTAWFMREP